jgi:hypothetical protein
MIIHHKTSWLAFAVILISLAGFAAPVQAETFMTSPLPQWQMAQASFDTLQPPLPQPNPQGIKQDQAPSSPAEESQSNTPSFEITPRSKTVRVPDTPNPSGDNTPLGTVDDKNPARPAIIRAPGASSTEPPAPTPEAPQVTGNNPATSVTTSPASQGITYNVSLKAYLSSDNSELQDKLIWHIFRADDIAEANALDASETDEQELLDSALIMQQIGGAQEIRLQPGNYVVTVDFGLASETKRFTVTDQDILVEMMISAGALSLNASLGADQPLKDDVSFNLYVANEGQDSYELFYNNAPMQVSFALNPGLYRIISNYGNINATVSADVEIESGRLTNITLFHKAARVTLKLVSESGGEAIANTEWKVLDEQGTVLHQSVSAFPVLILAEGEYSLVASNNGETYSRNFEVRSGLHKDVELVAQ